jgi:hypothetical protein
MNSAENDYQHELEKDKEYQEWLDTLEIEHE